MKLSVSILSFKDRVDEVDCINDLVKCKIDFLHLDIMDGLFVPNKTWNITEVKKILPNNFNNYDVHLMVNDLDNYIDDFVSINPKYMTFHIEATDNPKKYIDLIKSNNIKVGISLKPSTDLELLKPYLSLVDLVLVMSVEPGFGGQKFMESMSDRINELYKLRAENNYNYVIEVDGGVNNNTINSCQNCDIVVVGSYITNNNYQISIDNLKLKKDT